MKKFFKWFFIVIGILVLILSLYFGAVKLFNPDYDFGSLVPKKVSALISSNKEIEETTTEKITTTKKKYLDYIDSADFEFDSSKMGNQVGTLLSKSEGRVTFTGAYNYFSADGYGVTRFKFSDESSKKLIKSGNFVCLNILDDYLYYIDKDENVLYRVEKNGGSSLKLAENIKFIYVYDSLIYYISTDNSLGTLTLNGDEKKELYKGNTNYETKFVGISLSRVFFTVFENDVDRVSYYSVSTNDSSDLLHFREDTKSSEIVSLELENGYFYYYSQNDENKYNLVRKKYGSSKEVTLLENVNNTDYVAISQNRLYYSTLEDKVFSACELNMNSNETKTIISQNNCDGTGSISMAYGYQYVYLIGTNKKNGDDIYKMTCIYTSPNVVFELKKGTLKN